MKKEICELYAKYGRKWVTSCENPNDAMLAYEANLETGDLIDYRARFKWAGGTMVNSGGLFIHRELGQMITSSVCGYALDVISDRVLVFATGREAMIKELEQIENIDDIECLKEHLLFLKYTPVDKIIEKCSPVPIEYDNEENDVVYVIYKDFELRCYSSFTNIIKSPDVTLEVQFSLSDVALELIGQMSPQDVVLGTNDICIEDVLDGLTDDGGWLKGEGEEYLGFIEHPYFSSIPAHIEARPEHTAIKVTAINPEHVQTLLYALDFQINQWNLEENKQDSADVRRIWLVRQKSTSVFTIQAMTFDDTQIVAHSVKCAKGEEISANLDELPEIISNELT